MNFKLEKFVCSFGKFVYGQSFTTISKVEYFSQSMFYKKNNKKKIAKNSIKIPAIPTFNSNFSNTRHLHTDFAALFRSEKFAYYLGMLFILNSFQYAASSSAEICNHLIFLRCLPSLLGFCDPANPGIIPGFRICPRPVMGREAASDSQHSQQPFATDSKWRSTADGASDTHWIVVEHASVRFFCPVREMFWPFPSIKKCGEQGCGKKMGNFEQFRLKFFVKSYSIIILIYSLLLLCPRRPIYQKNTFIL